MNIMKILTFRHLKSNKNRTVITVLGIFISSFMITILFVGAASYLKFSAETAIRNNGQWHAVFSGFLGTGITEEQIEMLKSDDRIERVGCSIRYDNKTDSYKIENAKSDRLGTGTFFAADENCVSQMITGELEGSIPKNENEIIVNKEIIEKNGFDWKIGDTVKLSVGARTRDMSDYHTIFSFYHNEYHTNEFFILDGTREFKIVGILGDNPPTYSKGSIIRGLGENDNENIAYIELKDVNSDSYQTIQEIAKTIGIDVGENELYKYVGVNNDYLAAHFAFTGSSNLSNVFSAAVIILVIIIAASVVLIYNAFGMSLSERTRYLGMLSSVGATGKQIKASVYFEGLMLGTAAIPAGIGAGIIGVFIILKSLSGKIVQSQIVPNSGNLKMQMAVPLWAVIFTVIISIITILVSSAVPAKRASAITPIDALRQTNEIKVNLKRLKTSFAVRKIFGFEGVLADKNLKRNSRKTGVIIVSTALSVILFLSVNYFCEIYTQSNDLYYNYADIPYQVNVDIPSNEYEGAYDASYRAFENLKNSIKEIPSVKDVYSTFNDTYCYSEKAANPKKGNDYTYVNQDLRKPENLTGAYKNLWNDAELIVNFVEDDDFNEFCIKNGIEYKEYYEKNSAENFDIKCVVMNNISHKSTGNKVFTDNFIGEEIYNDYSLSPECDEDDNIIGWTDYGNETQELETKKIIVNDFAEYDENNYLCRLNSVGTISAYVPISMLKFFYTDDIEMPITLGVVTDNHEYAAQQIGNILDEENYTGSLVLDKQKYLESEQSKIFVLRVFVYSFIILLTLITLANIVNTISTDVDLRQREFAMLKSVGITQKGFIKIICLESLFYGLRALIFAIPLSVLISYALYKRIDSNKIGLEINYFMYFAVIAAVFAVVGVAMLCSVSKLKKASVIETLKKDMC